MTRNRIARGLAGGLLAFAASGLAAVPAQASTPHPAAAVVVTYDGSGAEEFTDLVDQAAEVWNSSVSGVHLQPAAPGETPDFTVYAYDGWPVTYPQGLGRGEIDMGREAVDEGYYPLRIMTHEMGHILGLPDNRTGLCSDLMSGHSAPTSCESVTPSPAEAAEVESDFASGYAPATEVYLDAA